jgi:hypothetical protein
VNVLIKVDWVLRTWIRPLEARCAATVQGPAHEYTRRHLEQGHLLTEYAGTRVRSSYGH